MASWLEVTQAAPEFAATVHAIFDQHKHKLLATLRKDGSPRLSGMEATFADGELWLGMMPQSFKALDLRRDPRLALHSAPLDVELGLGDAKLAGRAVEVTDLNSWYSIVEDLPADGSHLFRIDINEISFVRIGNPKDHLVIESWTPERGHQSLDRY